MKCKICGVSLDTREQARTHVKEKHKKLWKDSNRHKISGRKRIGLLEFIEK